MLLYPLVIRLSWLPFPAAGYAPLDALFELVSTLGTLGPPVGTAGPDLESGLKPLLNLGMLLGRLETLALLVLAVSWHLDQEALIGSRSMRFAFVCSVTLAVLSGRMLAERGHEMVILARGGALKTLHERLR